MTPRERILASAAAIVLAAGLSACATQPPGSGQSTPTVTAPAETATEPASPTPSETAGEASAMGLSGIRVGDPFEAATSELPGLQVPPDCDWVGFTSVDDYTLVVQREEGSDASAPIVLVEASVPADDIAPVGPRTGKDIGIGSTVDEVWAAYPDGEQVSNHAMGDRRYLKVESAEGSALFLSYSEGADRIWGITATSLEQPPYEACA